MSGFAHFKRIPSLRPSRNSYPTDRRVFDSQNTLAEFVRDAPARVKELRRAADAVVESLLEFNRYNREQEELRKQHRMCGGCYRFFLTLVDFESHVQANPDCVISHTHEM